MKKIIALIVAVAMIASFGIVASFASFVTESYGDIEYDAEAGTGKYNVTKYGTVYDDGAQKAWFYGDGDEYLYQLIELKEYAQAIQIGAGIGEGLSGELNIAIYNYNEDLYTSVEGTPVASGVAEVIFSSWRTGIVFEEAIAPGTYVLELTAPATTDEYWVAVSAFAEGMAPETVDISHSGLAGGAEFGTGLVGISFRTYLETDFVAPSESAPATETPATEAPSESAPATEAPATQAPEADDTPATEAPEADDTPATEAPVTTQQPENNNNTSDNTAIVFMIAAAAVVATVLLKKRSFNA